MSIEDKYDFKEFVQRIYIFTDMQNVYDKFARVNMISDWFVKAKTYHTPEGALREPDESLKAGDEYLWEWMDGTKLSGKIIDADGKENFSFTFGNEVIVKVKLRSSNKKTLVELRQVQNISDYTMRFENYMATFPGWAFYLVNLKSISEGGIDLRENNPDVEMLLNI